MNDETWHTAKTELGERRAADAAFGARLAMEVEEYFELGATVARGDVVLDVGANVGAFADACARRTGGDVTLHCFEPSPPTFRRLQATFGERPALRRARGHLHQLALWRAGVEGTQIAFFHFARLPRDSTCDLERKKAEFAAFFVRHAERLEADFARFGAPGRALGRTAHGVVSSVCRPDNRVAAWVAMRAAGLQIHTVPLSSIEHVVAAERIERIDLLKVDAEGAELAVLQGCGAAWPIVRSVVVETDARGGRVDEIVAVLERAGLRIVARAAPAVAETGGGEQVLLLARR